MAGLRKLQAEFPQIGDVRGVGLMVGVEFGQPGAPDNIANLSSGAPPGKIPVALQT